MFDNLLARFICNEVIKNATLSSQNQVSIKKLFLILLVAKLQIYLLHIDYSTLSKKHFKVGMSITIHYTKKFEKSAVWGIHTDCVKGLAVVKG